MKYKESIFLEKSGCLVNFSKTEGNLSYSYQPNDNSFTGMGEVTNVMIYTIEIIKERETLYRGNVFRFFVYRTDVDKIWGTWINLISIKNIITVIEEFQALEEKKCN